MERHGDEVHLNETEATGGVKAQGVRYVLGFSLLLGVIALSEVWILGSVPKSQPHFEPDWTCPHIAVHA